MHSSFTPSTVWIMLNGLVLMFKLLQEVPLTEL
jgi:hypothetical protein